MAAPGLTYGMQNLIPIPRIEPGPPAFRAQSHSPWITKEVPFQAFKAGFLVVKGKEIQLQGKRVVGWILEQSFKMQSYKAFQQRGHRRVYQAQQNALCDSNLLPAFIDSCAEKEDESEISVLNFSCNSKASFPGQFHMDHHPVFISKQ